MKRWWDQHVWAGQEGSRRGQRRLAVAVLGRDSICQLCGQHPATIAHHDPPWHSQTKHNPDKAIGVCTLCHQQQPHRVVKSDGKLR